MIEQMYEILFTFVMCVLALVAMGYLIRAMIGPKFSDRILAVNGVQTLIIMIHILPEYQTTYPKKKNHTNRNFPV